MQDLDTLRTRVDQTADKLATAESARRAQTSSLVTMLQRLEEKYTSQEAELEYYRQRIEPMEVANRELSGLMDRLLDLIDTGFEKDSAGALQDAAKLAADMLGSSASQPVDEAAGEILEETGELAQQEEAHAFDEALDAAVAETPEALIEDAIEEAVPAMAPDQERIVLFENVSAAVLDLETEEDAAAGTNDLPAIVRMGADMSADDGLVTATEEQADMSMVAEEIAAAVAADAVPPKSGATEEGDDPANDIKALLARVEALAAKAELMREPQSDATSVDFETFEEAPRRAGAAA